MGRIRIASASLIVSVVLLSSTLSTVQALDFSQFYLPPCCYIPPQGEPYSGYASAIVSTKHEPVPAITRELQGETTNFSLFSNKTKAVFPAESIRLYKLIVPIENEIESETTTNIPLREETTQLQPPGVTVENILFPDFENISEPTKFKRNSKSETTLGKHGFDNQKVILLDIETPEDSYSEKKSLYESEKKQESTERSLFNNETLLTTTETSLTKVTLLKPPGNNQNVNGDDLDPLQEASSETKLYSPNTRKMPAVWLQNLRRALYQSLTSEKAESSDQINDTKQRNSMSKKFWKTLRKAKLKYVDKLSQSSAELPEAIYLPSGQGPIVSGVVVNSASNGVELRLASELYTTPAEGGEAREECQCSLIHHGDIVMAYWTVSRIFNEHGNPALQYLVYPLPFTVPTPPELLPFPGNEGFRPSPIDPVANLKGIYQQEHNHGLGHQNNQLGDYPNQQIPSPPYFHQLSNGHHRLEITPNPQLHTTPIIPTGPDPSTIHPPHPQVHIKDYGGVLIENQNGYTPEFLNLYRAAILDHFRRKDAQFNDNLHYNEPTGPGGTTGGPLPHPILPTDLPHPHDPPVQENPIIGPTHLPPPPLSSPGPQSTHSPHYPNSIQDILAPIHPHPHPGPSLPPLDSDNFLYPHPSGGPPLNNPSGPPLNNPSGPPLNNPSGPPLNNPSGPPLNNPPTGNYHPMRPHDRYPPNERHPKGHGIKDKNRPQTPSKHPGNNVDKYPYPSKYPVNEGEFHQPYPFPPGKYPPGGPGNEFRPASQYNPDGVEGSLPYKPPYNLPERPVEPYQDRDRYDTNKIHDDIPNRPLTKGVGTAYQVNDKLYYPDSRPKPYVKYNTNKPQETKKLTQEINDGSYILNF